MSSLHSIYFCQRSFRMLQASVSVWRPTGGCGSYDSKLKTKPNFQKRTSSKLLQIGKELPQNQTFLKKKLPQICSNIYSNLKIIVHSNVHEKR